MVARPQISPFTPTFASAFNLKCCSAPLTFDSTFYFCFIKCDSNILIYVIFNAAYSKDSKFMSKEEMFKTSGNFIGLQALLRIMIDLLQMSLWKSFCCRSTYFYLDHSLILPCFLFLTRQAFHSLREIFFELNYLVTIRYMKEFSDSTTAREKLYGLLYKGVAPTPRHRGRNVFVHVAFHTECFFVVRFFLILDVRWLVKGQFLHW